MTPEFVCALLLASWLAVGWTIAREVWRMVACKDRHTVGKYSARLFAVLALLVALGPLGFVAARFAGENPRRTRPK